jgi:hypothetical protein
VKSATAPRFASRFLSKRAERKPAHDTGIYIAVWVNPKFLSTIIYTCGEFDAEKAVNFMREFFQLSEFQAAIF